MLDFVAIRTSTKEATKTADAVITVYPEFLVQPSEDLMIRGGAFYAVWDEDNHIWSRDEGVVRRIVDGDILDACERYPEGVDVEPKLLRNFSSNKWVEFLKYCGSLPDSYEELDSTVIFSDAVLRKEDYASKKLPYSMKACDTPAYEELVSTLYDPIERQKLEWAIGSVISGDSKWIQKFLVLYGAAGSGKSTMLNIIEMLFEGYSSTFEARALGQASNAFALEAFAENPLVSVQHDGDLSRIEDNTKLNSIVSHESLMVNEKYKRAYPKSFRTFLFMGTNKPVRITDAKSGIVRRLIDVRPSGSKVPFDRYQVLMAQVRFELGGIASHCLEVYSKLGPDAYDAYKPTEMIGATNDFFNFVEDHYDIFKADDGTTLTQAWNLYKRWSDETAVKYPLSKRGVKEELKAYFKEYVERKHGNDGRWIRNAYLGFDGDKLVSDDFGEVEPTALPVISLDSRVSLFDKECASYPAQLAKPDGTPTFKWDNVKTVLSDLDTRELHYVKVPENHIVIDFDIPGENGEKNLDANLRAASRWPSTYAELSKSGGGVHLHYIYEGDPSKLAREYADHIEIKVFTGNSSLRRKLTRCNDIPIATLSSGLPERKGGKKMLDVEGFKNEKILRSMILKNLKKAYMPGTKPSVEFIGKLLKEAYESGKHYDVSDLFPSVMAFANDSTHHSLYCVKLVNQMPFHSDDTAEFVDSLEHDLIFYDVEVFPNLFVVVWKKDGDFEPVKMVNPLPSDIEKLLRFRLIGFNNRRYDNHILYGRLLGYDNQMLYNLSQAIISGSRNAMFREAYNLSYADIYDFSSKKQSLKKWEIELGIHHLELGLPWDKPVDESLWDKVAAYCVNDVLATEAVFHAREDDFKARELLADLSGLSVNDTTRMHTTRIIFGNDKHPQEKFVYTDLSEMFPGYKYEFGRSTYRGEEVGEGGYVYSEPGMYEDVALLDIASMHPNSLIQLNLFGDEYTDNFKDLLDARLAIKHKDWDIAGTVLGGRLKPYLDDPENADKLAYALKIVINSVYGLTAAKFECEFKDPRNIDNIVAKRGALFMVDLKHAVQEKGFTVAHIKTDSIKIPNATPEIISFVMEYGAKYGYTFEHEATYSKLCLVNDAVYVCKDASDGHWSATGAQFQVPYIFKSLFSHEELFFEDFCETKTVTGTSSLYLDMNENLGEGEHDYRFVGKAGSFTPVKEGCGGGLLMREKDGKYYAATGTKGYRWLESELVSETGKFDAIDESYYESLMGEAKESIGRFGSFDDFVKE